MFTCLIPKSVKPLTMARKTSSMLVDQLFVFMNFWIEFQTSKKTSSIEFKLVYSFEFFNQLKLKLTSVSTGLNYTSNMD